MALKVFEAHLGFYDTLVAAASQPSALAAWGSKQNLFHLGFARVVTDADKKRVALSRPGIVFRRAFGTKDAFSEHPEPPRLSKITKQKEKPRRGKRKG